ncbi:Ureidoglycolate lyase [Roseovarius sp. EC-HK134]|uniref:ureidoglycolate lyase n=1 Tax=unclassified Roseovarius TaxID=2614913 RepID=UPI00125598F6|nr:MULTISPECIES: ureidoglycolate lyase [unclassified Roseovarius]VVT07080.1 Ureidoglycolate lyase [Roseovarius sp. EC-HK134]VVT07825.1 Ureidoglycolate lyase [Roseovarius sp. EC-SD190]
MTGAGLMAQPLTAAAFAPYGDVLEVAGAPDRMINAGLCGRFHDRARLEFLDGRAGISLFDAEARHLPYALDLMERHPLGSQAFIPLDNVPMLICVAEDTHGRPTTPRAFLSQPGQGINLLRNVWHGVLAPIGRAGRYAVIDRIGPGDNLEEYHFDKPLTVEGPQP